MDAICQIAFGWEKLGSVGLSKTTKARWKAGDLGELETFYFRY